MDRDIAIERRYELSGCVSRGAFGEVLRAVDRTTGEPVAVKRLHEHLVNAENAARVMREAERIGRIDSPHVVRCHGWGRDDEGRPCLVLEWLEGEDLGRRRGGQSVIEGLEIARQAAAGLSAIHRAGFIHGDVKPSNLVLSRAGGGLAVKLIDLGVARNVGERDPALRGLIVGTPSYMSPEQARGDDAISPASDLFSLGIVIYELLAGRRPFTGSDPFVVLAKILLEDPPLLGAIAPHVPPALDALVMRALAKLPEQRFRSADELMEALGRVPVSHAPMAAAVDETPTVQLTPDELRPSAPPPAGMSATSEQRVVTAVFARFSPVRRAPPRTRRRRGEAPDDASVEPHDTAAAVEAAMAAFETVVTEHRGVAHRTIGGRMIAVFGAVRSSGDEAERAARAALAGLGRVPSAQVAITTGRAVASLAGLSGTAIERGAAEVERAPQGSVRVDEATARLIGGTFALGGEEKERVLLGERAALAPVPLLLGRETPMVGRDRELGRLLDLYRRCLDEGASRSVRVIGPPGSGKSRLRFEFLRRLREPAPTLLFGRAESLSAGSPFGLLRGALRRAARITSADPLPAQQKKLRALFARHLSGKALGRAALFLGELANVPFPDDASEGLRAARNDPMLMGDRMRAAWEDWLLAACDEAPVVIVLEDLHWGDLPSAKFVETALRLLRDRPLFVLAVARSEIQEEFEGTWLHRPSDRIELGPLAPEARMTLARAALPDGTPEETARFVCDKSEGNPFYLEELVRAVAAHAARAAAASATRAAGEGAEGSRARAGGDLGRAIGAGESAAAGRNEIGQNTIGGAGHGASSARGSDASRAGGSGIVDLYSSKAAEGARGRGRATEGVFASGTGALVGGRGAESVWEGPLPETVLGMVQARLDALGAEAKAVLRAASVLGNVFRPEAVRVLLGDMDPARLDRVLAELTAEEALTQRTLRDGAGVELVFRNALVRDAAYAMLTEDDRAAGHRLAAELLAAEGQADAATLAGHHARARDAEGAARWYLRAAEQALEGNDFSAALEHAERAAHLTSNREVLSAVRVLSAEVHRWRGEMERAEARGREAAGLCEEGTPLWFRAVAEVVTAAGRQGRYEEVAAWTERAISTVPRGSGDVEGRAREDVEPEGARPSGVARAGAEGAAAKVLFLSRAAVHLGYAHREDLASRLLAEVDDLTGHRAPDDPRTAARIHQIRALFALRAGDTARYVREHVQALAAFEEAGDLRSACLERVSLGSGYADLGAYAEAEVALSRALASAERMGLLHIAPWALQNLGYVRARLGRKAEARACLDRAREAGGAQRDARLAGGTRIYLSRLAEEGGRFEEAEREAREAAELLAGVPAMRAGALAARARALHGMERTGEALTEARAAMEILDGLGPGKMGELEAFVRVALIEALLASGEHDAAREAARTAKERLAARAALIGDEALRESFLARVREHARTTALAAELG